MNRRSFLQILGFSAAAAALGVKPLEAILHPEPVFVRPLPVTTAELGEMLHKAYAGSVQRHLAQVSPLTSLFPQEPWEDHKAAGRRLAFPAHLS